MDHSTTKHCSTEVFKLKSNRLPQGNNFYLNFSPFDIKLKLKKMGKGGMGLERRPCQEILAWWDGGVTLLCMKPATVGDLTL